MYVRDQSIRWPRPPLITFFFFSYYVRVDAPPRPRRRKRIARRARSALDCDADFGGRRPLVVDELVDHVVHGLVVVTVPGRVVRPPVPALPPSPPSLVPLSDQSFFERLKSKIDPLARLPFIRLKKRQLVYPQKKKKIWRDLSVRFDDKSFKNRTDNHRPRLTPTKLGRNVKEIAYTLLLATVSCIKTNVITHVFKELCIGHFCELH